jgi:hypothetical protein
MKGRNKMADKKKKEIEGNDLVNFDLIERRTKDIERQAVALERIGEVLEKISQKMGGDAQ